MQGLIGQLLAGKYRITRRVGGGALADVYEGVHEQIGQRFAIKVLKREFARFPDVSRRFLNEARAASAIGHPGIIQVFDVAQLESGELYMVMEMLQGEELSGLMEREGPVSSERAAGLGLRVLDALDAAHRAGVIHRDLKPENIVLTRGPSGEEWVKIIDFGVARLTREGPAALRKTAEGSVIGTPYYISPEQAKGLTDIDPRTDLYSVGVILFELVTGELPFSGMTVSDLVKKVTEAPFPRPSDVEPTVSVELEDVILRATARDRKDRFADAREFIAALRKLPGAGGFHATLDDESPGGGALAEDRTPGDGRARPTPPRARAGSMASPSPTRLPTRLPTLVVVPARLYAAVAGAALLAAAVVAGVILALARSGPDRAGGPSGPDAGAGAETPRAGEAAEAGAEAAAAAADAGVDAGAVPADVPADAGPGPADAPEPDVAAAVDAVAEADDGGAPDAAPAAFTVTLAGVPAGAEITADDRPVADRFVVPSPGGRVRVRVTAPGYRNWVRTLRVDGDLDVRVEMQRPDAGPRDAGTAQRDTPGFVPNPFGDAF